MMRASVEKSPCVATPPRDDGSPAGVREAYHLFEAIRKGGALYRPYLSVLQMALAAVGVSASYTELADIGVYRRIDNVKTFMEFEAMISALKMELTSG